MKNNKLKTLCLTAVFTAIVFVFTAYLHIPSHTGYTHIGDGFIYLAACLLPMPYAVFVGVAGAFLADCLTGFAIWAPASIIIKAVSVLFFSSKSAKIVSRRNTVALLPSALFCCVGYYLYEALIFSNFVAATAGIIGYFTQSILSSILFITLGAALDKIKFKKLLGE